MTLVTEPRRSAHKTRFRAGAPIYAVRGSLIVFCLERLRQTSAYERYVAALDPTWREQVLFFLASSWAPVELAVAHHAAYDSLVLSTGELAELGGAVSERVAGSFFDSLVRGSRTHGVDLCPWTPLREYRRMVERLLQGGSVTMRALAEKEALLEIDAAPLLGFVTFRQTMLALTRHAVGTFAHRAFVRELPSDEAKLQILVRWL